MAIIVSCTCGKKLQVPDNLIGSRVRCADCQAVVAVPDNASRRSVETRLTTASRREPVSNRLDRERPVSRPTSGGSSGIWLLLVLGALALVLFTCLGVGGVAAYFMYGAYRSAAAESEYAAAETSNPPMARPNIPAKNAPAGPPILNNPGGLPPGGNRVGGLDVGMKPDCQILWGGVWYDGKILQKENDRWFVHYVGWEKSWDEWVGKDRIRFVK